MPKVEVLLYWSGSSVVLLGTLSKSPWINRRVVVADTPEAILSWLQGFPLDVILAAGILSHFTFADLDGNFLINI